MKINISFIPIEDFKFTTIGHWFELDDTIYIQVANMSDWRFQIAVLFHEVIEYFVCKSLRITTADCDAWDEFYEEQYAIGAIDKSKEAGDDKRAPYHIGHKLGSKFEVIVIKALGASWRKYLKECDSLMGIK